MSDSKQPVEAKSEKKNRPKVEPALVPEQGQEPVALADLAASPIGAASEGSVAAQAAWLGDARFQAVQRQTMAAGIGQVRGNQDLLKIITASKRSDYASSRPTVRRKTTNIAGEVSSSAEVGALGSISVTPASSAAEGEQQTILPPGEYEARRKILVSKLRELISGGKSDAEIYRASHKRHMEEVRGWIGIISDFVNDVVPPSITMWGPTINAFKTAEEQLNAGDIREAYYSLRLAYTWLADDVARWKTYRQQTIEGAESVVTTLRVIRDAALVTEVALLTGGSAYFALGGGKVAAATATVVGVTYGAQTAATMPGDVGEAARGTLAQIKAAGFYENMRRAAYGLYGMAMGIGKGFTAMLEGLNTLFTNPRKSFEDLGKLNVNLRKLWRYRKQIWNHFANLPPEKQAQAIGEFTGTIESFLMTIEAGNQIGSALQTEAAAEGIGLGGTLEAMPGDVAAIRTTLIDLKVEALAVAATGTATGVAVAAEAAGLMGKEPEVPPETRLEEARRSERGKRLVLPDTKGKGSRRAVGEYWPKGADTPISFTGKAGSKGPKPPRSELTQPERHVLKPITGEGQYKGIPKGLSAEKRQAWLEANKLEEFHPYSRAHDAEAKMFEKLLTATDRNSVGEFHFKVTHKPCPACTDMIFRFKSMRPGIEVIQH